MEEQNIEEYEQTQRCLIEQLTREREEKIAALRTNTVFLREVVPNKKTVDCLLLFKLLSSTVDEDSLERILETTVQSFMWICYFLLATLIFNIVTVVDIFDIIKWVLVLACSILTFLYNKQAILEKVNLVINYQFSIKGFLLELAKLWSYRIKFFGFLQQTYGIKRTTFGRKRDKKWSHVLQKGENGLANQDPMGRTRGGAILDLSTERGGEPKGVNLKRLCKIENQNVITCEISAIMAEDFFNEVLRPDPASST